ncbi:MAG: heme-binding protein, partial [Limnobacter sp.]|nr:heme-binding protein [Limnobacter sp.]
LDGFTVPSSVAAIAKAITGAYLSSTGNAFTTRTASQIVQEYFQPGEKDRNGDGVASGPLYGVQFSQLPCSDLNVWLSQSATIGPKRSPIGLSADPGGFPIYENGRVVGGIGVMASANAATNAIYSLDDNLQDVETDLEEEIAMAALPEEFRPPEQIQARFITANGQAFQYSNTIPGTAAQANVVSNGAFVALAGYKAAANAIDGTAYGTAASGYVATQNAAFTGLDTFNLVTDPNDATSVRFPTVAAAGNTITQAEVESILVQGMTLANRARGQIRIPLGAAAQVTVSIVDTQGNIIGLVRSADAPIFGTDVSVQKARSALLFSGSNTSLSEMQAINGGAGASFVNAMNSFFANKNPVLDGSVAYSARSIGNVHRPFFPDAIASSGVTGPLSTPISSWSPFNVGFQLNVVSGEVLSTAFTATRTVGANNFDPQPVHTCVDEGVVATNTKRYANGFQIFPGGFPIYKGDTLVGAVGISGDGVDQDDMVGYLGVINAATATGSNMRPYPSTLTHAGELRQSGVNLKYVQCPQVPFNDSSEQDFCPAVGAP